jgi:TPR repeat protein
VIDKAKQGNAEAIYNIGCVYASKENKDMAILWLGMSSALGFYESQLKLGDLFQKDSPECALTWYKLAFSNGITSAGTPIGDELLANGKYEEAKEKYIKAAEGSDPYCQNHLGEYYRDGYRVEDPYDRFILHYNTVGLHYGMALKWFQRAADQNYAKAQYNVAELYDNGWGVDKNKYTALHWYEKSRSGGYENADKCIERLNKEGYFYLPQRQY